MTDLAPNESSTFLRSGSLLGGRYEIGDEIGRGGYSVVYAARDRELDCDVAIKLLVPPPAHAHVARERMRREVKAVRQLSHSQIVAVHDFVDASPWSFIVMEHVPGPDLAVRVGERGGLAFDEVVSIGRQIASALSAAHRRGILHRDVKPQNILLDPERGARLTDFGSAKLEGQATVTQTGGLVGTLGYTAPEVIAGERGDARSDVYALGMTLFFALTAGLPERPSPHLPPPPSPVGHGPRSLRPDVPSWLNDIVARATAASPSDRFPTAASLAAALESHDPSYGDPPGGVAILAACLICGAPEPLGLGVCPRCGGTSDAVADALIFVRRPLYAGEREEVAERLRGLLPAEAHGAALAAVARGHRALVSVPAAGAESVVEQLALRDIRARAVRTSRAWAPLPLRFYGMLGLILSVGGAAGAAALPPLAWTSPLLAGLLLLLAQRRMKRPLVRRGARATQLPPALQREVIEIFKLLPTGSARSLLADVIRMGQALYGAVADSDAHADARSQLEELLTLSCSAAVDLADIEESLARLDAQKQQFGVAAEWSETLALCQRTRDGLVQRLLEVIAALGRARSRSAEFLAAGAEGFSELTREIATHFEAHAEAARELDELLGEAVAGSTVPSRFHLNRE